MTALMGLRNVMLGGMVYSLLNQVNQLIHVRLGRVLRANDRMQRPLHP
jgi:hypothetical protein